jgi:hypothetical protein
LGLQHLEVGDQVAILADAEAPFVLRPCEDDKYKFVSGSYIHGIMDGEFIKESQQRQTFELAQSVSVESMAFLAWS